MGERAGRGGGVRAAACSQDGVVDAVRRLHAERMFAKFDAHDERGVLESKLSPAALRLHDWIKNFD